MAVNSDFTPSLFHASTMHARLFPAKNAFRYRIYYLALPLSQLDDAPISNRRFSWLSFRQSDHGYRDDRPLITWARDLLAHYNMTHADGEIILFAMPRILGYVFNPVSFYLCFDHAQTLQAVICEVNNTFGETHTYVCDARGKKMVTDKVFHVSPFLKRHGSYDFRFEYMRNQSFAAYIDFFNDEGRKQLVTNLKGTLAPLTRREILKAFFTYPLVTFKTITLIHYQAAKLLFKKVKYISKPDQMKDRSSVTKISR